MGNTIQYKRWTLDAISFTDITAPINCDYVVLLNEDDTINVTLRSAAADSATEKTLEPGVQEYFEGEGHRYRFPVNSTVVHAQAASGTVVLHASYLL